MKVIVVKDKVEGGQKAFEIVQQALENGMKTLGLATGSTPETLYENMVASDLDFSQVVGVNLDEYIGLTADHPQSYATFMKEHLFNQKPFKETYIPNGMAPSDTELERYDEVLSTHPIDLQILGIGNNAHIGFNEPGSSFEGKTSKVHLTPSTIEANKRFFDSADEVPRYAYSMGLASIMAAKQILLIAYGENKAEAIAHTLEGPVTEAVPASILQRHDHAIFIIDEAAASQLKNL
ncbi:glucosamine-6-phosphate deaminase [Allofustis seminis]|uniref:glucosamine-6-phosphate deaminase n=1 Tax=Allofustis seminis TaxID=166939 RepID=UPI0004777C84|nr:glucosamine-6-phosphate deaminase [Allofustis seminis]